MTRPRLPLASSTLRRSLLQHAAAIAALVGVAEVLIASGPISGLYVPYLFPAAGALYSAAGLLAWWRRPANRLGSLMTACGATIVVSSGINSAVPGLIAVGFITATLPLSVQIHLVHACPSGEVVGRASRLTVAAGYVVGLVLQAPLWAFTPLPPPYDVLVVAARPDLADLGGDVQRVVGAVVVVATVWLVLRRLRGFDAANRRVLAPLLGFAIAAVLTVAVGGNLLGPLGLGEEGVADVQLAAVSLVPLGFLLVVLRGGFAPPAPLGSFAQIVASAADDGELDEAVAGALGDPSAALLRWDGAAYVDRSGQVAAIPADRSTTYISGPDAPLAAVVRDTSLENDPDRLAAVSHVIGIALERDRLARDVSDSRAALGEASRRVLDAADAERRRIARDLHDGLQGSLVLLSLQARQLGQAGADAGAVGLTLAEGLDAAARSLRELVDGVLPAPLVERGLAAAIDDLLDQVPLEVRVEVDGIEERLPAPVETTAYLVVAEAVTNVLKHASASRLGILVRRHDGILTVAVEDDGTGGVDETHGTGLSGLRDRLAILGGVLETTNLQPGARVRAALPCA